MPMTPRERVLASFAHEEPDRVPLWFGASPEFWQSAQNQLSLNDEGLRRKLGDDFRTVHERDVGPALDALHAVQTTCLGMELTELKKNYGRKLVFNGGIDSHHILINSTPDIVRERTREILNIMMPGGGYVAGASHDSVLVETPLENVLAMCETIRDYGVYQK